MLSNAQTRLRKAFLQHALNETRSIALGYGMYVSHHWRLRQSIAAFASMGLLNATQQHILEARADDALAVDKPWLSAPHGFKLPSVRSLKRFLLTQAKKPSGSQSQPLPELDPFGIGRFK